MITTQVTQELRLETITVSVAANSCYQRQGTVQVRKSGSKAALLIVILLGQLLEMLLAQRLTCCSTARRAWSISIIRICWWIFRIRVVTSKWAAATSALQASVELFWAIVASRSRSQLIRLASICPWGGHRLMQEVVATSNRMRASGQSQQRAKRY